MDCLSCTSKMCKVKGVDCFGLHDSSVDGYSQSDSVSIAKSASELTSNGRAGTLSRTQEIVEYCKSQNFKTVGLAYCFGIEKIAEKVKEILSAAGIQVYGARCTIAGVKEHEIDKSKSSNAIACNPLGQAEQLNRTADFVIEVGLCLGHDVLFHQKLTKPFTVLLVKDRVYGHNPLGGIEQYLNPLSVRILF